MNKIHSILVINNNECCVNLSINKINNLSNLFRIILGLTTYFKY